MEKNRSGQEVTPGRTGRGDGAGSAKDRVGVEVDDCLEKELDRVFVEEYGTVIMSLAEALRQRNELKNRVERLELEKVVIESEAEQHKRMAELWESRALQAERHVELLTDKILVLEQQPQQQFHTPQQEEEVKPPRMETPPPPPPGKRQKLERTPGGTRLPEGPPPDEEWPCAENDWVVDGISYKPAWARGRSASRGERRAPGVPP